jgi:hypothetical protein
LNFIRRISSAPKQARYPFYTTLFKSSIKKRKIQISDDILVNLTNTNNKPEHDEVQMSGSVVKRYTSRPQNGRWVMPSTGLPLQSIKTSSSYQSPKRIPTHTLMTLTGPSEHSQCRPVSFWLPTSPMTITCRP